MGSSQVPPLGEWDWGGSMPDAAVPYPQSNGSRTSVCRNQAVRIQEGRYRHPGCYTCADCSLNLKMRGHFWVGDELYCEKHARQRYSAPPTFNSQA